MLKYQSYKKIHTREADEPCGKILSIPFYPSINTGAFGEVLTEVLLWQLSL